MLSYQLRTRFGLVKFENIIRKPTPVYLFAFQTFRVEPGWTLEKSTPSPGFYRNHPDGRQSVVARCRSSRRLSKFSKSRKSSKTKTRHRVVSRETCTFRVSEFTATEPSPADGVTHYPIVEYSMRTRPCSADAQKRLKNVEQLTLLIGGTFKCITHAYQPRYFFSFSIVRAVYGFSPSAFLFDSTRTSRIFDLCPIYSIPSWPTRFFFFFYN